MKKETFAKGIAYLVGVISLALAVLVSYWIILKLTNHSPELITIVLSLFTLYVGLSTTLFVQLYYKFGRLEVKLDSQSRYLQDMREEIKALRK